MHTVEQIKTKTLGDYVVYVKYVRVGNDYRFAIQADWFSPEHRDLVKSDETPTSAGIFKLYRDRFEWESGWSMSLQVGSAPDDEDNLKKLFF